MSIYNEQGESWDITNNISPFYYLGFNYYSPDDLDPLSFHPLGQTAKVVVYKDMTTQYLVAMHLSSLKSLFKKAQKQQKKNVMVPRTNLILGDVEEYKHRMEVNTVFLFPFFKLRYSKCDRIVGNNDSLFSWYHQDVKSGNVLVHIYNLFLHCMDWENQKCKTQCMWDVVQTLENGDSYDPIEDINRYFSIMHQYQKPSALGNFCKYVVTLKNSLGKKKVICNVSIVKEGKIMVEEIRVFSVLRSRLMSDIFGSSNFIWSKLKQSIKKGMRIVYALQKQEEKDVLWEPLSPVPSVQLPLEPFYWSEEEEELEEQSKTSDTSSSDDGEKSFSLSPMRY